MTALRARTLRTDKRKQAAVDAAKERTLRTIVEVLQRLQVTVRREELKRGPGWRVMSGGCRLEGREVLFVDRRVTLDEQIEVVLERLRALSNQLSEEMLSELPEAIVRSLIDPDFQGRAAQPPHDGATTGSA